ncbi:MAG: amino acid ABC transporter substrate-binding protein [Propionivibrio sp.]|jgi:polar amino acid transport system substrate-binding protein|nr:amino acid ABC transporter substrate-binding protein [Propionivibrio sp.]MBP7525042.1 amino acid ABC transporter substrate-binding protein [Propionivibrio sp.]
MRFLAKLLSAVIPLSIMISAPTQARDWSVIEKSGTIIAATEGAFAPFNYYEGTKLTGYEVDVAEALAKKLGMKLEWHAVPFDSQLAAVRQDRFDFAIASHGYTKERAKAVDFANPHYCTGGTIAAPKDGPLTVEALKGKTVGVQLATSYFDAAKKIAGIKEVKTYKADPEVFSALKAKKIDAWISDKFTVMETLNKNTDSGIITGEQVFVEKVSLIMRKNNKEFMAKVNQALEDLTKDGTLAGISDKYFKTDITCK